MYNFMKILPVAAELFHADRRMKSVVTFRNYANAQWLFLYAKLNLSSKTYKKTILLHILYV